MTPKVLASVLAALKISAEDLGCSLPESNDEADLVHLLVSYPTNASINEMRLHTALDAVVPTVCEEYREPLKAAEPGSSGRAVTSLVQQAVPPRRFF